MTMRFSSFMTEAFDKPARIIWPTKVPKESTPMYGMFQIGKTMYKAVIIHRRIEGNTSEMMEVHFKARDHEGNWTDGRHDSENALQVFATVIEAAKQSMEMITPTNIRTWAFPDEDPAFRKKRERLYAALFKKMGKQYGYTLSTGTFKGKFQLDLVKNNEKGTIYEIMYQDTKKRVAGFSNPAGGYVIANWHPSPENSSVGILGLSSIGPVGDYHDTLDVMLGEMKAANNYKSGIVDDLSSTYNDSATKKIFDKYNVAY